MPQRLLPTLSETFLKIDFKNAFNLLSREAFVRASSTMFPGLERWTWWCYNQPPLLVYNHSRQFFSECGVQQGDPLGPLYFCCGLQALIDQIATLQPVYQKWYMDDGGIVGSPALLSQVWEILDVQGKPLGLKLNPAKCEWSCVKAPFAWSTIRRTPRPPIVVETEA